MEEIKETVISVKNVSKVYKLYDKANDRFKEAMSLTHKCYHTDHYALSDINFDVHKGECIGIIGTNGSGKSTLLKIITGVLNATSGEISVNGRISALLELGAGFNMEYTGVENVYLNGTMMGLTKEEVDERFPAIEEFAEIGDFINQPVKTYSSGMFARLAFAVAINVDPDILIVDEALSVGDIFFQAKCYRKFNEFKKQGKTIVFVSHDMSSVLKYCEACLLIHKGKQIALGKSSEVIDIYKKILVNQYDEEDEQQEQAHKEVSVKEQTAWKEKLLLNPNYVEYGEGVATMIDFAIIDEYGDISSTLHKGTEFEIKVKVQFNQTVKNPIVAYTFKDLKGTEITGTNTMLEGNNIDIAHAGDVFVVKFKQKMDLQGGQYLLSLGCTGYELDTFVVYHRLYDMINVQVLSERNTIGFYDMNSSVEIE